MVSIGSNTTRKIQDYLKTRTKFNVYFKTDKLFYEVGKVRYMRQFYEMIENTKWNIMCFNRCNKK